MKLSFKLKFLLIFAAVYLLTVYAAIGFTRDAYRRYSEQIRFKDRAEASKKQNRCFEEYHGAIHLYFDVFVKNGEKFAVGDRLNGACERLKERQRSAAIDYSRLPEKTKKL